MIINVPNSKDYEDLGFECLIQAYKNINQVDNGLLIPNVPREEIWQYNIIVLKTSIVLIHQGIEALLKSKISRKSPFLLLEQKRSDWKTLPENDDINFTDMYTISGEDLIKTFYATLNEPKAKKDFRTHFEKIRILRNKIVHGLVNDSIIPEDVLTLILWTFTYLNGKGSFWRALQDKFYDHPGHKVDDLDLEFEEALQYQHLDYLEALLGNGELNNHFEIDLKSRRYYCPNCTGQEGTLVQKDNDGNIVNIDPFPTSKWAFLKPNEPKSTNIFCLVCQDDFTVERTVCNGEEGKTCPGNVLFVESEAEIDDDSGEILEEELKLCLTCMDSQKK